jgi:hypothetical protein
MTTAHTQSDRVRTRLLWCLRVVASFSLLSLDGCATVSNSVSGSAGHSVPLGSIHLPGPGAIEAPLPAPQGVERSVGSEAVFRAFSLLGAPYKFGGSGPTAFDCSGLVQFVYDELGIDVPRTAAEQYRAVTPVKLAELEPGDLVFFKTHGSKVSHVGIYAGSNRFVHAPMTGRPIELRALDDKYYSRRFAGGGRVVDGDTEAAPGDAFTSIVGSSRREISP